MEQLNAALAVIAAVAVLIGLLSNQIKRSLLQEPTIAVAIGIAAIFYATFARGHVHDPIIWHAASALIFASILIHGVTAAPLTRLYAHRAAMKSRAAPGLEAQSGAQEASGACADRDDQ